MDSAKAVAKSLEAAFSGIQKTRMNDVPILNPALAVEAVGFRDWNGHCLGVLITPWFINLMLLPGGEEGVEKWQSLGLGASVTHILPAGRFNFIVGEEEAIGRFQMCSLFSPVLEFEDHEAARITAESALQALMADEQDEKVEDPDRHMLRMAKGDFPSAEEIASERERAAPHEVSRRNLLTVSQGDEESTAS